jgi:hypothetical protein
VEREVEGFVGVMRGLRSGVWGGSSGFVSIDRMPLNVSTNCVLGDSAISPSEK